MRRGIVALALLFASREAAAQTWVNPGGTPSRDEIVAVDATGEPNWLYGVEDLFGDGAPFLQPEQAIDFRTAYAATDGERFWARAYVSDPTAVDPNVTLFVFVNSDQIPTTGGSAAATEIDPRFLTDPTDGGYDHVLEIVGDDSVAVWDWQTAMNAFVRMVPPAAQGAGESGQDRDPIEINGDLHGYRQGSVVHALLDVTAACNAILYFRSVEVGGELGDLDIGIAGPCVPVDANDDDVPDVVVPPDGCTADDQCPNDGVCVEGRCVVPEACIDDTDCAADERCNEEGICVPIGGNECDSDSDCGDLVCRDGACAPCTPGSDECGSGRVCGNDGRCVGGVTLAPGQEAQGGSFACALGRPRHPLAALGALALCALALLLRRTPRRKMRS
jgi:hypothetical protein